MNNLVYLLLLSLLCQSLPHAGHPKKYLNDLKSIEIVKDGEDENNPPEPLNLDEFVETLNDFFGNRRQFWPREIVNLYDKYKSMQESKFWRWLVRLSNNIISKDLYSTVFFYSRSEAAEIIENMPDGTGLFRPILHSEQNEMEGMAVTYKNSGEIKSAILSYGNPSGRDFWRDIMFCQPMDGLLTYVVVMGTDLNGELINMALPKMLLHYPVNKD